MENILAVFLFAVLIFIAFWVNYLSWPHCPKCRTKMEEMPPHGDQDVYKCGACEKEWISL